MVVATVGFAIAVLTVAVGHCSAFGGRCPAEPQPLWENDVFGGVGSAVAVSVFAIAVAVRPSRRGVAIGSVVAVTVGLGAGWGAVAWASGFRWSG